MSKISVIIPTYNRINDFQKTINSVIKYLDNILEIIVVNDYPDSKIVMDNVTVINNKKNLGAGLSRNIGAEKANGDVLLFLDDDVILKNNITNDLQSFVEEGKFSVISTLEYQGTVKNFNLNKYLSSRGASKYNHGDVVKSNYLTTAFFAIHRNDFFKMGGFSSNFKGYGWEDTEFGLKLEKFNVLLKVIKSDSVHMHHKNCSEWSDQLINSAGNFLELIRFYPSYQKRFRLEKFNNRFYKIILNRFLLNFALLIDRITCSFYLEFLYRYIFICSIFIGVEKVKRG
ncbi:MAG: glycosyltransferase family 2 protein [Candidatus Delongbacteria bacterium]|nr:glycosyltransferase family 2 protein [Candidatus Delongbacteria bacterium]MBN2835203.1 glycosyltransferase family 2 protein [Candidatus Delongbacteria bacterium]